MTKDKVLELDNKELSIILSALNQLNEYTSEVDVLAGKINAHMHTLRESGGWFLVDGRWLPSDIKGVKK